LESVVARTSTHMVRKRTLRAPRLSVPRIPQRLTILAPRPLILGAGTSFSHQVVITAAGMFMGSSARTGAKRWAASIIEPVALGAPAPVILLSSSRVVQGQSVHARSDANVGTAGTTTCVAVVSQQLAFGAPSPLVLSTSFALN
jgi:hypothetical protein